tara:strand:+ start:188 stop:499 length:312 start_codon:yes stop_codon:yes gene_type:complete
VPDYPTLGKLKKQDDGKIKGYLNIPLAPSMNLKVSNVQISPIDPEYQDDYGNTHRIWCTQFSAEENEEYRNQKALENGKGDYSAEGGNPQPQSDDQPKEDIPF